MLEAIQIAGLIIFSSIVLGVTLVERDWEESSEWQSRAASVVIIAVVAFVAYWIGRGEDPLDLIIEMFNARY